MPIGWIDFSKTERNKVLSVLELLSERGTLDELGIAPIRDGFANIFFPGTSTIQTRAKYFLIVPYALKDMEYDKEANPTRLLKKFDELERQSAETLLQNPDDTVGVIGRRALGHNSWVKRTPADIYWAGLRAFNIFRAGNLSLTEYIQAICAQKQNKRDVLNLGNRNDQQEENDLSGNDSDDKDAGDLFHMQFWTIPTYQTGWMNDLDIHLSVDEADFLKDQIIRAFPDSMFAFILKNNRTELLNCASFQELESFLPLFPEEMQKDYILAADFSNFLFILRVLFNIIVSDGQNESANQVWSEIVDDIPFYAEKVDLDAVFNRLMIHKNDRLYTFLNKSKEYMLASDIDGMIREIKRRERELKHSRAKTMHPGEFDSDEWLGGGQLDYRFSNAKTIMNDIFESEGLYV